MQEKTDIITRFAFAKELTRVFLEPSFFVLKDADNSQAKEFSERILSMCRDLMDSGEFTEFAEVSSSFKDFLDNTAFNSLYGKKHTFGEISGIILDVLKGTPLTKEKDIVLIWDNLDKFSPEVAKDLKPLLVENLREVIKKQSFGDNNNRKADVFVTGILKALENNKKAYPMASLNKNGSVSIYIDTDWEAENPPPTEDKYDHKKYESYIFAEYAYKDEKEMRQDFSALFSNPAFIMSLEYAVERHGFTTINGAPVVEVTSVGDVDQYRINLSPENLDSILKEHWKYVGYRDDGSILDLYPRYELKPGKMMLSPVASLGEDGQYVMRIAGCQLTEIPSVQLLHMLPSYDGGKIGKYHWDIKEVVDSLSLNSASITQILSDILMGNGVLTSPIGSGQSVEGATIITAPKNTNSVKIIPMDEVSKRFYAQFGQCTMEELASCQSLEVNTVDFLLAANRHLEAKLKSFQKEENTQEIEKIDNCKARLAKLIEREIDRTGGNKDREIVGEWTLNVVTRASSSDISQQKK